MRFAPSIRARLMALAVIAILPLLIDRIYDLEIDRAERIAAASRQALNLARQGMARQNEAMVSIRALLQVAASAHGQTTRGDRCDDFLGDAVEQAPWLKNVSFVEPGGRIICSSNPDTVGLDVSDKPHIIRALKTRTFAVSDYFAAERTGPTLLAALPHRARDGSIDLLVTGVLDLSWFEAVAGTLAGSFDAVVMMVDGNGTVLVRQPSRENWVGRNLADHPVIRAMLTMPEGVVTDDSLDSVRRVFGFVELPGAVARLAVGFDESEIVRRANREILTSFAGLGLLAAVILIGIWFGAERLIVALIRLLARTAQWVGKGDLAVRARELPWASEFVPLAAALDDMAGQLADREQQLRDSNGQLCELAYMGGLTGIPNRRAFNAHLAAEWKRAVELKQTVAALLVDVDHFKLFNDCYGHLRGDACLRTLSGVLKAVTRATPPAAARGAEAEMPSVFASRKSDRRGADFAARYGGEEFAVLLRGADLETATMVGERLRRAVEDLRPTHEHAPTGIVTVSIGVASLAAAGGEAAQRVIELADAGLYEAKRRARK